ncbi:helix-turn-helix transcriptional regulator [Nocardia alba]|uniref:Helix-turn-helix protein n=1 Tax=Nocardia alba TaxID=225051 RepID=A0A4R1FQN6_9NOCA|nr:helix-turn-helix transcriptional regulator [Nocardia alba]TCJ96983.1 helix-turn-helix protein [Nocardia alba]
MSDAVGASTVREAKRAQLAEFLKSRRARISPDDVGMTRGSRRRTPGLRREEVAQLSGVGVTWYTWLEQGRPINASVQVLDAVARTLGLDHAEKVHLYRLADVPSVPAAPVPATLPPGLPMILDTLSPLPAVLLDAKYNVLAHNDVYRALFPGLTESGGNILRTVFLTPACCNPYQHKIDDQRRMVAYLRGAYVRHLDDPTWQALIDELCGASAEFADMWARNDVAVPVNLVKVVRHPAIGDLAMHLTMMSLSTSDGEWIQVFTPIDDEEAARLSVLLAMPEQERLRPVDEHRRRFHAVV